MLPDFASELDRRRIDGMASALMYADVENKYDAWDAFVLHSLGRHYAYSDFVSIDEVLHHRPIAFDPVVFDLYLSMPPSWRAEGKVAHAAMMKLSPKLMQLDDSNTGFSARFGFSKQIALILTRALLRRINLAVRDPLPDCAWFMDGYGVLFRYDTAWRNERESLPEDPVINDTGLFKQSGLRSGF